MTCPQCAGNHSDPMRRRFFAVVKAAYDHWPHNGEFIPDDSEHLRAWLLTKVGWRTSDEIPTRGIDPETVAAIAKAAILASRKRSFVVAHNQRVYVLTPKSIQKSKSSHRELVSVFESVEHLIKDIIGVDADMLLLENEKVA